MGSLVRELAGSTFVVALSKSYLLPCLVLLNPGSHGGTTVGQTVARLETMLFLMCCPRDLVSKPDNMDETVLHMAFQIPSASVEAYKCRQSGTGMTSLIL